MIGYWREDNCVRVGWWPLRYLRVGDLVRTDVLGLTFLRIGRADARRVLKLFGCTLLVWG